MKLTALRPSSESRTAALYLFSTLLVGKRYVAAMRAVGSCMCDDALTAEERRCFRIAATSASGSIHNEDNVSSKQQHSVGDMCADAVACRLAIVEAVCVQSGEVCPWAVLADAARYVRCAATPGRSAVARCGDRLSRAVKVAWTRACGLARSRKRLC